MITQQREDYLLSMYRIDKDDISVTELSKKLNLAKSTVSERVSSLVKEKLVHNQKYGGISLTRKGKEIAKKLLFKHRVIEVFLHKCLNISENHVHEEAHKLEHACSDEVISKLYTFLNKPTKDPHGNNIQVMLNDNKKKNDIK